MNVKQLFTRYPQDVAPGVKRYRVRGLELDIADAQPSIAPLIFHELQKDYYGFKKVRFERGDTVIDIGGHIGIVSMFLAKKYPFLKIYSFEPVKSNYEYFVRNLVLNGIDNITLNNLAITKDRRELAISGPASNTGGVSAHIRNLNMPGYEITTASSITMDDIWERFSVGRCKLLKIDCEGSEYEILKHTKHLGDIDWISAEFHINTKLAEEGESIDGLVDYLSKFIERSHIQYTPCQMGE